MSVKILLYHNCKKAGKVTLWLLLFSLSGHIVADELPAATGEVLLTVSGNIEHTNVSGSENIVEIDLAMLEAMEQSSFVTRTPWTEGKTDFGGVNMNRLLEFVGANSNSFEAFALDDYHTKIENFDFKKYPALLAYRINGNYLGVRDLGPLWIMFPFDDYPELVSEKVNSLSVWQLIKIVVD